MFGPLVAFEDDFATNQILKFGAHTRNEIALLRGFVHAGDLVYDIGAHIGSFAIPLAIAVGPLGRLVAVEADARSFPLLWRNLASRGLIGRVAPVYGLAGGSDARHRAIRFAGHTSATYFSPDADGEPTPILKLDDLHACFGGARPAAVIKIDVEGMELAVLRVRPRGRSSATGRSSISRSPPTNWRGSPPRRSRSTRFYGAMAIACFATSASATPPTTLSSSSSSPVLTNGGPLFDALAIPAESARIARACDLVSDADALASRR